MCIAIVDVYIIDIHADTRRIYIYISKYIPICVCYTYECFGSIYVFTCVFMMLYDVI